MRHRSTRSGRSGSWLRWVTDGWRKKGVGTDWRRHRREEKQIGGERDGWRKGRVEKGRLLEGVERQLGREVCRGDFADGGTRTQAFLKQSQSSTFPK